MSLRDIAYARVYQELDQNDLYHIKLPDGGLLQFQYTFLDGTLRKHRLAYFPPAVFPSIEEAPDLYLHDQMYGDIVLNRLVRFPVRFDFDPDRYRPKLHPHSHLTLGQFEHCRIPVTSAVEPYSFLLFILRNFYFLLYRKNLNRFERRVIRCRPPACITAVEKDMSHFSIR